MTDTERLRLRAVAPGDLDRIFAICGDPATGYLAAAHVVPSAPAV